MPSNGIKSRHQANIEKVMQFANQELHDKPTEPSDKTKILRARLILEEAFETIHALGISVKFPPPMNARDMIAVRPEQCTLEITKPFDLIAVADGCADISVVTIGTLSSCGIPDVELLEEVDRSNLDKFRDGAILREDGKFLKPDDWQPPNIAKAIGYESLRDGNAADSSTGEEEQGGSGQGEEAS